MQFSEEMSRAEFEGYFAWSRHCSGPSHRPNFDRRDDGTYCDDAVQRHWWTWHCATIHARQQGRAIAYDMLGCEADKIADKLADAGLFGRWQDEYSSRGERACHETGAPCFATCEGGAQAA